MKQVPVIDLGACVLCEICVDLAPHAFEITDLGYVAVIPLSDYSDESIHEAVKNCPRDAILWESA